jgi:hypothetical protein
VNRTLKALEKSMKINTSRSNLDKQDIDADIEARREQKMRAKLTAGTTT